MITIKTTRRKTTVYVSLPKAPDHRALLAQRLDRLADFELHLGHHGAAERLAWRAAEMRGDAR